MLKIRDEIDLKELEKFGFEYDNGDGYKFIYHSYPSYNKDWNMEHRYGVNQININAVTREIKMFEIPDDDVRYYYDERWVNDLIKADLVEKSDYR